MERAHRSILLHLTPECTKKKAGFFRYSKKVSSVHKIPLLFPIEVLVPGCQSRFPPENSVQIRSHLMLSASFHRVTLGTPLDEQLLAVFSIS